MFLENMFNIEITSSNYNPDKDTSITITATCLDFNDNPVIGKSLTIKRNGTTIYTGTTNTNGQISTSTTCGTSGSVNFSVKHSNLVISVNPYPVNSIYMSVDSTSPATLFGGTWEQIGQGRTLIGQGTGIDENNTSKTFTNGETYGEYTHTLTTDEMPSHTHTQNEHNHTPHHWLVTVSKGGNTGVWKNTNGTNTMFNSVRDDGDKTRRSEFTAATNQNTGGGQEHNNMPPYLVVYIWKRTA